MIELINLSKHYKTHNILNRVFSDLTIAIQSNQKLALLGHNGAGKSTLIRLIGKVELPSAGKVFHHCRVSWPIGFSGAFQGSLSGIDNIRFIARIYRQNYPVVKKFVDDFAELGDNLKKPVKNYSSGMRARLAFALSLAIDFDVYLIDEVILVGDYRFQERCKEYLFNKNSNKGLIIASHDLSLVSEICDSALKISNGHTIFFNDINAAIGSYRSQS